jgi:phosphoribosyl 1,2-cyclic phosphodiesterase
MLRFSSPESDESFRVLVDCSQAVKRQMCITRSLFGQMRLDAVMLTSRHVDKFLGLNDLREVQHASQKDCRSGSGETLPIYASRSTIETVKTSLPYLFSAKSKTKTLVAGLVARGVSDDLGERVSMSPDVSVTVRTLPGKDEQLGFVFGRDEGCVVLLSDPNISSNARAWLSERDVKLLIIGDVANRVDLSTCAQLVKAVKPRHATITGLSCALDHAAAEDLLQTEVGQFSVSVAYDGMRLKAKIADDDLWQLSSGECSCLSSGSTATGGASSGGDSMTDEDRYMGLSPTHGPAEAGAMETTPALTPVSLSELAGGPPGTI